MKGSILAGQARANKKSANTGTSGGDEAAAIAYFGTPVIDLTARDVENADPTKIAKNKADDEGGLPLDPDKLAEGWKDALLQQYGAGYVNDYSRTDESVANCKGALKAMLDNYDNLKNKVPTQEKNLVLPITLEIEIDGIEGFKWGNKVNVDYLPFRLRAGTDKAKIYFRVMKTTHSITENDWTTKVETFPVIHPSSPA